MEEHHTMTTTTRPLVSVKEIAARLNAAGYKVTPAAVYKWAERHDDFPAEYVPGYRVWSEVEAWCKKTGRL